MIHKILLTLLCTIGLYSVLFIIQLWGSVFSLDTFFKLSVTFGVFIFLEIVSVGVIYGLKEDKELEKGNYLG